VPSLRTRTRCAVIRATIGGLLLAAPTLIAFYLVTS
jgi:hypothetical protein